MIGESETINILKKINGNQFPVSFYNATTYVDGDYDRRKRVIDYLLSMGLVSPTEIGSSLIMVTKNGIKLIEKNGIVKEDRPMVKKEKAELTLEREGGILEYLDESKRASKRQLAKHIKASEDVTYQVLRVMVEEDRVQMWKEDGRNVYALPGYENETVADEEVDTSQKDSMAEKYRQLREEYKDMPESKGMVEDMSGSVAVELVNETEKPPITDETIKGMVEVVLADTPLEGHIVNILSSFSKEIIIKPNTLPT